VRLRVVTIAVCGISLVASAGAQAYPWPVKPFYRQHPIRANFCDPRTSFLDNLLTNGAVGPGTFQFHNGIDISAPDDTPVYPVVSGRARIISGEAVAVAARDGRTFQYFHLIPEVVTGEHVYAQRTVLGYIRTGAGHVHLTEIRRYRVWNPLAKGGITPYEDLTDPTVRAIYFRHWNSLQPLSPNAVCGKVSISADAYDTQSRRVTGTFAGFPVSPALLTWSLTGGVGTRRLAAFDGDVDFRTTLPAKKDFWRVYARGTYQNDPRFGRRQYPSAGLFMFLVTRQGLETRDLPNGTYKLTVHAFDIKGNEGSLVRDFRIENDPLSPTGCPAAVKQAAQPPAEPPVR
jgi:hypothetical protein